MARQVNDVVLTGNGLLVTFDDNTKKQYIWKYVNNSFALTDGRNLVPYDLVNEIINKINVDGRSVGLWSHLFGVAGNHLSASAISQIGSSLTTNTWEVLLYDNIIVETHSGLIEIDGPEIILPPGEFQINASALAHRSGSGGTDGVVLSIQGYDNDLGTEIPFSFKQGTTPALNNSPISVATSFLVDNDEDSGSMKSISIRVHADTNRCTLGANSGKIPAGSQNNAGYISIFRLG